MSNAREEIIKVHPSARIVRGTFGKTVATDEDGTETLGDGRAYWDEEAWISAIDEMERINITGESRKP
jgi:hypothetical protein